MWKIKNIETDDAFSSDVEPIWTHGIWECGAFRITDPAGTGYVVVAPAAIPPKIGPIAFQMLFTSAESVAADDLKVTDKTLSAFWKLIDDPRTNEVDLSLKTVQNAIEYTLTVVKASGVAVDVPTRKAQILTGVVQ